MRRALLLSTVLLLTACGGDEAKEAFVQDATQICERAAADSEALTTPKTPAEFAPYAESLVRIAEQAQQDLGELELPEGDRADLQSRVLEPFADVVEEGRAFAAKVRAAGEDQAKLLPLLSQVPDAGEVDLEYLRDYGLGTCADVISRE
jgi:hypothetical protein